MVTPLPFAPPTLSDAPAVRQATRAAQQSDLSFANIYLLRRKYGTEIVLRGGTLLRHFSGKARLRGYAFPCGGGDPVPALHLLEQDAALRQRPFRFCLLTEVQRQVLEGVFPGRFRFASDPGDADYLYERSMLAELPGARFHRKRNHLARFWREFPNAQLRSLTPGNAADALAVASAWLGDAPSPALLHEHEAIVHALQEWEALQLLGALLYMDERPVAISIASMIGSSVADVHYEKCHPEFREAYPVINQGLASMLTCPWVNREEDLNFPGLRQAKLSYFPSLILSKYTADPC